MITPFQLITTTFDNMTEVETKIYTALTEIKRLLPNMVENVNDTDQIRHSLETLTEQLLKAVGRRTIKESLKYGQKSPS